MVGSSNFHTPVTSTIQFDTSLPHKGQSLSVNKIHHCDTSLHHKSVTSTRYYHTNPSLRHKPITSTRVSQFHTTTDGFLWRWRISAAAKEWPFCGSDVLKLQVCGSEGYVCSTVFKKRGPKITSIRTGVTKFYFIIV